jgi:signal transduction histidine kinase
MSHELRTPLNSIVGFTELVARRAHAAPARARQLRCKAAGLLTLINEVLELARIEAGRMMLSAVRQQHRRRVHS